MCSTTKSSSKNLIQLVMKQIFSTFILNAKIMNEKNIPHSQTAQYTKYVGIKNLYIQSQNYIKINCLFGSNLQYGSFKVALLE